MEGKRPWLVDLLLPLWRSLFLGSIRCAMPRATRVQLSSCSPSGTATGHHWRLFAGPLTLDCFSVGHRNTLHWLQHYSRETLSRYRSFQRRTGYAGSSAYQAARLRPARHSDTRNPTASHQLSCSHREASACATASSPQPSRTSFAPLVRQTVWLALSPSAIFPSASVSMSRGPFLPRRGEGQRPG